MSFGQAGDQPLEFDLRSLDKHPEFLGDRCRPVGFVTRNPPESSRTYSSIYNGERAGNGHGRSMLGGPQAWSAAKDEAGQWVRIDVGQVRRLAGVVLQGRKDQGQWVERYRVRTSLDGAAWTAVSTEFPGCAGQQAEVEARFASVVEARHVELTPTAWHGHPSLRAAVLECAEEAADLRASQVCAVDLAAGLLLLAGRWYPPTQLVLTEGVPDGALRLPEDLATCDFEAFSSAAPASLDEGLPSLSLNILVLY